MDFGWLGLTGRSLASSLLLADAERIVGGNRADNCRVCKDGLFLDACLRHQGDALHKVAVGRGKIRQDSTSSIRDNPRCRCWPTQRYRNAVRSRSVWRAAAHHPARHKAARRLRGDPQPCRGANCTNSISVFPWKMTLARTSTPSHLDYLQLRFLPAPPETAV